MDNLNPAHFIIINDFIHKLLRTWRFQREQTGAISSAGESEQEDMPMPTPEPETIEPKDPDMFNQLLDTIGDDPLFPLLLPDGTLDRNSLIPLSDPELDCGALPSLWSEYAGVQDSAYFTTSVSDASAEQSAIMSPPCIAPAPERQGENDQESLPSSHPIRSDTVLMATAMALPSGLTSIS